MGAREQFEVKQKCPYIKIYDKLFKKAACGIKSTLSDTVLQCTSEIVHFILCINNCQ